MKFNNETLRIAVLDWCKDKESTLNKFGDINDWNTSEVTDMSFLFENEYSFNSPIDKWNVSKVENMQFMFKNCWKFNQPLNNWDVSNVKNMRNMFNNATVFNQPLSNWDVSNVIDMSFMFLRSTKFNKNINNWDVSNVKKMKGLFDCAYEFNKPLNNWNVSNVVDMSEMFSSQNETNLDFNQPLDNWNVSNVKTMSHMFFNATEFNQPLNNWDVSSVENMSGMFRNAKSFNQTLDNWDMSNVTDMEDIFLGASSFNKKMSKIQSKQIDEKIITDQKPLNVEDYLVKKSQIKINNQYILKNNNNKFKLIDYIWNGGNDFNYNIFDNEPFPEGEYIGSPSSSELKISVNGTTLYIKHYDIQDGPIEEGYYLCISQNSNYDNIEWFKYKFGRGDNPELITIIFILCIGLRDEDFVYGFDGLDFYDGFDKVELNIEIDVNKLKNMWEEFMG